jgi:uridine kinase
MPFDLETINRRARGDAEGFALECEGRFNGKVAFAAESIANRIAVSRVVLISGPSGSGKTTTAKKICDALKPLGIRAHSISMDKYFVTPSPETVMRTEDGEVDRESPHCLDLEMLGRHFALLERGEEIVVPHFNFKIQSQDPSRFASLKLAKDEIVIFEGIHALNDMLANATPDAFKLYISARSDVENGGEVCFKRTWTRIMRRAVRDEMFRGTGAAVTLSMWANVRRGEKKYISPYKSKADLMFDSSMEYEIPAMKTFALRAFGNLPENVERIGELRSMRPALTEFEEVSPAVVAPDSILREFIGGGIYDY